MTRCLDAATGDWAKPEMSGGNQMGPEMVFGLLRRSNDGLDWPFAHMKAGPASKQLG